MGRQSPVRYSVLDLAPILAGGTAAESFRNTLDLARHAEALGYERYWVAEHHNIAGVASAATAVLIGHIAGGTSRIRVGAGGIMLPNHAPLVIAEQFGTLESLYPERIDLGLGRAPGGDGLTMRALRRGLGSSGDSFPQDLQELRAYLRPATPDQPVRAIPGAGLEIPLYLLGSSDFSARLAAQLGLPFAFASHFAPAYLHEALQIYRAEFQPSETLDKPYVIVGVNVFAADSDAEARRLMTSLQQRFLAMIRRVPEELQPPVDSMEGRWSPAERAYLEQMARYTAAGAPDTLRRALEQLIDETAADELIMTGSIYDHAARRYSYTLAAAVMQQINEGRGARGEG
jgi:luciferase family oxidoreductase group 1